MLSLGDFYFGWIHFPNVLQRRPKEDMLFVKAVGQGELGCMDQDLEAGVHGPGPGARMEHLLAVAVPAFMRVTSTKRGSTYMRNILEHTL